MLKDTSDYIMIGIKLIDTCEIISLTMTYAILVASLIYGGDSFWTKLGVPGMIEPISEW